MKNVTVKTAFCGVIAALSVVLMFFTGVVPVMTIAIPAIAGCLLIPVVAECGVSWGMGVFAATSVLSFLLAGDREAFLMYVLFFGYYPVIYALLDRCRNRKLMYALKLLVFNGACILEVFLASWVFGIPFEETGMLAVVMGAVLLILANIVFVMYDRAVRGLIFMYFAKFHKMVRKTFRFK